MRINMRTRLDFKVGHFKQAVKPFGETGLGEYRRNKSRREAK